MPEKINLRTADNVNIAGDHYKGLAGSPGVLLLHMMPADKKSWAEFAKKLNKAGFGALAIDLRGHGESEGGPDGWRDFSEEEHQKSVEDVRAAVDFQISEGHSKIFLAGASIGANLALQYLAESDRVLAAVLLSAGLNYKGIETLPLVQKIDGGQGVFFIAARDDVRSGGPAEKMAQNLYDTSNGRKKIKIFDTGGHGTDLFKAHPELKDDITNWFKEF